MKFMGYRRPDGRVGVRNYLAIIPSVFCANKTVERIAAAVPGAVAELPVEDAEDFVRTRLAPATPPNDGRQTPMRGHPVFVAQHATATCCRGCLEKWWKVPKGSAIPPERQARLVDFLMAWIVRELLRSR